MSLHKQMDFESLRSALWRSSVQYDVYMLPALIFAHAALLDVAVK